MQVGYVLWKRLVSSFGGSARRFQYIYIFLVLGVLNFKYYFFLKKYFNEKCFHYQYFLQPF